MKYILPPYQFLKLLLSPVVILFFYSCAQIVNPEGGPKDTQPPQVISYKPDSASLNFKEKSFTITFNEYVQLKDLNGQLVVSPPLIKAPDVKIKKKSVVVTIEDTLRENTTYTFNFGSAIQDITEGNYSEGFRYIFSTGPHLDSISLTGKVLNANDLKTESGILVMLYHDLNDSVPYKKTPSYFAKTKKDGSFGIYNIKPGKYKAFALKDINANYMYDSDEEQIGFAIEPIDLHKNDSITISLFKEVSQKLFIKKSTVAGYGHLLFVFNRPLQKTNIHSLYTTYKKQWYIEEYGKQRDSLHIWLHDAGEPDSLSIVLSENDKIIDTLFFNLLKKEDAFSVKKGKGEKISLSVISNAGGTQPFDLNKKLWIEFNHPIKSFGAIEFSVPDSVKKHDCIMRVADDMPYKRVYELSCMKVMQNEANGGLPPILTVPLKEKEKYSYYMLPGLITDIFGLTNDTIKLEFTTREEKYYGTLKLKLKIPNTSNNMILQLLDDKEKVVSERLIADNKEFNYTQLAPHKYKFKIIYDANGNGKWDTGNYSQKLQPEKVIYSKEDITIRSNWDQEVEWSVEQ